MLCSYNGTFFRGFNNLIIDGKEINEVYYNYRPQLLHKSLAYFNSTEMNKAFSDINNSSASPEIILHFHDTAPNIVNEYEPLMLDVGFKDENTPCLYYTREIIKDVETNEAQYTYDFYCNQNQRYCLYTSNFYWAPWNLTEVTFDNNLFYLPKGKSLNYSSNMNCMITPIDGECFIRGLNISKLDPTETMYFYDCPNYCKNLFYTYDSWLSYDTPICNNAIINMFYTYNNCQHITKAVFGSNVKSAIGTYVSCSNIVNINISQDFDILSSTFSFCNNIVSLYFNANIPETCSLLSSADNLRRVVFSNNVYSNLNRLQSIGSDWYKLTSLTIGENMFCDSNTNWVPYSIRQNILEIKSYSPYVTNVQLATCYNLRYPINAPNATNINYCQCYNLKSTGNYPNATRIDYSYCNQLIEANYGDLVINLDWAFSQCNNLEIAHIKNGVTSMSNAFSGCPKLHTLIIDNGCTLMNIAALEISGAPRPTGGSAYNLRNFIIGSNVPGALQFSGQHPNLQNIICYSNKINKIYCNYCPNLVNISFPNGTDGVINLYQAYYQGYNLETYPIINHNNVTNMAQAHYNCYKITTSYCGNNVTNMNSAFYGCNNITEGVIGPNVLDATMAYGQCYNLTGLKFYTTKDTITNNQYRMAPVAPYQKNKIYIYFNDPEALNVLISRGGPVIEGPSASSWTYNETHNYYTDYSKKMIIYTDNSNIFNSYADMPAPVDYENMTDLSFVYEDAYLYNQAPFCGEITVNMYNAFANCYNLIGPAVCKDNVCVLYGTYQNCHHLDGAPVCGNNVTTMDYSYANCYILTGNPICGPNVTSMRYTYVNCRSLTGAAQCGDLVKSFISTYSNCHHITSAACGPNVTSMRYAYDNCHNLTEAVCGDNVTDMAGTYASCSRLINAACGPNVTSMTNTYRNCEALKNAVCGDNVTNMARTYTSCFNLLHAACGPLVTNMAETYSGCSNLEYGVCGPNVTTMYCTYTRCSNLISGVIGPKVINTTYSFADCSKLQILNIYTTSITNATNLRNTIGYLNNAIIQFNSISTTTLTPSYTFNTFKQNINSTTTSYRPCQRQMTADASNDIYWYNAQYNVTLKVAFLNYEEENNLTT